MKIKTVMSSELHDKPWGVAHHFLPDPSPEVKDLVTAADLFRRISTMDCRPFEMEHDAWDALGNLVQAAIQRHAATGATSTYQTKLNQNTADRQYLTEHGLLPEEN
jgi:hypothetical protein